MGELYERATLCVMVSGGGARRGSGSGGKSGRRPTPARSGKPAPARKPAPRKTKAAEVAASVPPPLGPIRLGAVPGATPGKWIDIWNSRVPHAPLVLVEVAAATQHRALVEGLVDVAIVRLPIADADDLHVIPLYEELPVAVFAADSHLAAAEELDLADLEGEVVVVPSDDVLRAQVPGAIAPRFAAPADTAEAVAIVASGVGVTLMPLSLARANHRKDVDHRPVRDAPRSPVGLAWLRDRTTPEIEAFVGIVRGRTAHSSRS
ncbi:LysR family substrate-binding domain-containing protein [Microbacterium aurantiacum]|uniref:LysR family substrate-binding domain-containing protein n=1 Tax=Microbacterium aurantiacum TaxID=162393 RepID=UPI001E4670CB|nr:LysR family substrate-binding domain-containing protein [Microbacterium chocolatum]